MKTIKEQIDSKKKEINFHLNVETLVESAKALGINLDITPKDFLKAVVHKDFVFVEKRTEGINTLMANAGLSKDDLKAYLKQRALEKSKQSK